MVTVLIIHLLLLWSFYMVSVVINVSKNSLFLLHSEPYIMMTLISNTDFFFTDNTMPPSIRIFYRNTPEIVEPNILKIPYCGETCPLERFAKLYENLLTVDFDYECGKQVIANLCRFPHVNYY